MNTEPTINNRLAECLRRRHPVWRRDDVIVSEQTGVLVGESMKKPDVLVRSGSPVIVEAEIAPAGTVDGDTRDRLGVGVLGATRPVEAAVALVYPDRFRDKVKEGDLEASLEAADDLRWRIFSMTGVGHVERFPEVGDCSGGVDDLAAAIETLTISPRYLDEAADTLEVAVTDASALLDTLTTNSKEQIGACLYQAANEQTMRMASAVVADAFLCQTAIAEGCSTPNIDETRARGSSRSLMKHHVLDVWDEILDVNYWPIFSLAVDMLTAVPDNTAGAFCDRLAGAAQELAAVGAVEVQDLAGQMLGRLIADRKFLATFYTRPSSAALLAELAVARLDVDWSDPDVLTGLRIADLACGTGALLSAAYRRVAVRHRRRGRDPAGVHAAMMGEALIGADVMPAAAHLTTMMLSAASPSEPFEKCSIHVVPYGLTSEGKQLVDAGRVKKLNTSHVRLGSLELLGDGQTRSLFGQHSTRLAGRAEHVRDDDLAFHLPAGSVDVMIMNPPFTRPTGHESDKVGVPVPSFAGMDTSPAAQKLMSEKTNQLGKVSPQARKLGLPADSAGHGNAGLASQFIDLAHAKLRPNGVLALILPAQVVAGSSWEKARELLRNNYRDLLVVAIADSDSSTSRAFSADTGMAEVIIVATKNPTAQEMDSKPTATASYATLRRRPESLLEAHETARAIQAPHHQDHVQLLRIGDENIGWLTAADFLAEQLGHPAGVNSHAVAAAAAGLMRGSLVLPRLGPQTIPTAFLQELGVRGPYHLDINGPPPARGNDPRGPFDITAIDRAAHGQANWPTLWSHEHQHEIRMAVLPDTTGTPRPTADDRALALWEGRPDRAGATRLHINRDFRVNSQPLGACLTPNDALGGRAWPSSGVTPKDDPDRLIWEKALCVWLNTTPGLIGRWWVSGRQQSGRALLSITTIGLIPVPNLSALDPDELNKLAKVFDVHHTKTLLPANEAWHDDNRKELDRAVLCDALGLATSILSPLDTLREQWCAEPSVHGNKNTRPPDHS